LSNSHEEKTKLKAKIVNTIFFIII